MRKFGSLSSSTNPEQLSATVSGAILSVSSLIVFLAGWMGVPLAESEIAEVAQQAGMAAGALWFLYGAVRKLVVSLQQRFGW